MRGFIDGVTALVDQNRFQFAAEIFPTQCQGDRRALWRDIELAIAVIEHDIELVGIGAALFGQVQTDQARAHLGRDIATGDGQAKGW